ncbi:MAG: flavoprotein [Planctomycetota bacterium]
MSSPVNADPKKIILSIGGGIAAYKSAALCSGLVQSPASFEVHVAMTHSAKEFIGPATLAALSGRPVADAVFQPDRPLGAHIELAENADLMIVAPATANLISAFATGRADDLISTLYLQVTCPVFVAPAMSSAMWEKPSVQRNVATLRDDGCQFIGPESGWLSCRRKGDGRMSEPDTILSTLESVFS